MLKSYITIALKRIVQNKLVFLINTLGLSVALACCLVIFVFVEFEFSVDQFHKDADRVFLTTQKITVNNNLLEFGKVASTLGEEITKISPEIQMMTRVNREMGVVSIDKKDPFYEVITFAEQNYLDLFNFPLKFGNKESLADPSKIIISEPLSIKYFGNENPINKVVKLSVGNQIFNASIAGVAEEFPKKRSFEFDILINRQNHERIDSQVLWQTNADAVFLKLKDASLSTSIVDRMNGFLPTVNKLDPKYPIATYALQPLNKLALNTYSINGDFSKGYGAPTGRIAMMSIGLILLITSCLNYVNTFTALSMKRLKEVGVRKVLGSKRKAIVTQFMVENLVVVLIATVISVLLAKFFFLPGFDGLFSIGLELDYTNYKMWIFLLGITMATSILSGLYPSLYASKFEPAAILRKSTSLGGKSLFLKIMLAVQYVFAVLFIVVGIMFMVNEKYQKTKDLGYDNQDVVLVMAENEKAYTYIKNQLSEFPNVKIIAGANDQLGYTTKNSTVEIDNVERNVREFEVESKYFSLMNIELKGGNELNTNLLADDNQIVVNEKFIEDFQIESPINKRILVEGVVCRIVGVTDRFEFSDFKSKIEPVIFKFVNSDFYAYMNVKAENGQSDRVYEVVKKLWKDVTPNTPPNIIYQDQSMKQYFSLVQGHTNVMLFTAFLAILLSTLGLFGLVYLNISRKMKNYSIMKVFGASTFDLIRNVSKNYIWYILSAIIIGVPISYFATGIFFSILYEFHAPFSFIYLIIAILFLLVITISTISFIVMRLARANPMEHLREN